MSVLTSIAAGFVDRVLGGENTPPDSAMVPPAAGKVIRKATPLALAAGAGWLLWRGIAGARRPAGGKDKNAR